MKLYLIVILCVSLLLQSCTSMSGVSKNEGLEAIRRGTEDLEITLKTGARLNAGGNRYLLVSEPGDYYFGTGVFMNYRTNTEKAFTGTFVPVKIFSDTTKGTDGKILCWRNDTSAVQFRAGDYVRVTPESGTGLYIMGMNDVIPLENIDAVKLNNVDGGKTVLSGLGIIGGTLAAGTISIILVLFLISQELK